MTYNGKHAEFNYTAKDGSILVNIIDLFIVGIQYYPYYKKVKNREEGLSIVIDHIPGEALSYDVELDKQSKLLLLDFESGIKYYKLSDEEYEKIIVQQTLNRLK